MMMILHQKLSGLPGCHRWWLFRYWSLGCTSLAYANMASREYIRIYVIQKCLGCPRRMMPWKRRTICCQTQRRQLPLRLIWWCSCSISIPMPDFLVMWIVHVEWWYHPMEMQLWDPLWYRFCPSSDQGLSIHFCSGGSRPLHQREQFSKNINQGRWQSIDWIRPLLPCCRLCVIEPRWCWYITKCCLMSVNMGQDWWCFEFGGRTVVFHFVTFNWREH